MVVGEIEVEVAEELVEEEDAEEEGVEADESNSWRSKPLTRRQRGV